MATDCVLHCALSGDTVPTEYQALRAGAIGMGATERPKEAAGGALEQLTRFDEAIAKAGPRPREGGAVAVVR